MSMEMNMNVRVTSLWMKTVENATKEIARECIMRCAEKYGFDGEEAISELFVKTDVVEMKKRSIGKKTSVKEVNEKEKEKEVKSSMILPFSKGCVNETGCCGLAFNKGLFTQCPKKKMEQGNYCKTCQKEADGSASGTPNNGTIEQRLTAGLMEFRDPKGRSPIRYSKLMEKQGLTREMVEEEARKFNYEIDEEHFTVEDKDVKRGRPKVEKKKKEVMNATVEDVFAKISFGSDSPVADPDAATEIMTDSEEEKDQVELTKKPEEVKEPVVKETVDKAAKAAEKAAKAAEKAAEKVAKAEQLAAEKAAKAAEKAAEKAAKAAEKAAEKAAKEEKKKTEPKEKAEKKAKTEKKEEVEKEKKEEPDPAAKKVKVTRITISGIEYLKSVENILYNPDTKEEVGIYDEDTKTIQPLPDEDEEEMSELTADGYDTN